jgi:UDP-GlcNAc:undecaprenyl-phosphate GlcNAc-1-phosphate transferase
MGVVAVEGAVKKPVVVSFVLPLILLAVPFLDTTFVVLKRLKYRRPIYAADDEHFHHRMARIGFSSRRTIAYLYTWTLMLAGFALALRFVPYSDHKGHLHTGWTLVMVALALIVVAASVYLVYVLEILKFRRLDSLRIRRLRPDASPAEVERSVALHLETGEYDAVMDGGSSPSGDPGVGNVLGGAQQGVGERKVDQDRVGAEHERGGAQAAAVGEGGEGERPYRVPGQQPGGR